MTKIVLKMTNLSSKHVAYVVTLSNKVVVLTYTILHYITFISTSWWFHSNKYYVFWVCICSLRYPACNAHAPYFPICPAPPYNIFSTLSHKRHDSRKKVTEHETCVLIFFTTFVWNNSRSKIEMSEIWSKMYICVHVKYRLLLSEINETCIFLTNLRQIFKYHLK